MAESAKLIPVENLLQWLNAERAVHQSQQEEFKARFEDEDGNIKYADDPDVARFAGKIGERAEVLQSFTAFVVIQGADIPTVPEPTEIDKT